MKTKFVSLQTVVIGIFCFFLGYAAAGIIYTEMVSMQTENKFFKAENNQLHKDLQSTIGITNAYKSGKEKKGE